MSQSTRILAARYLRILHAIDQAHTSGRDDEVESLLAGVDPVDVRQLAEELEKIGAATRPTPVLGVLVAPVRFHPESLRG